MISHYWLGHMGRGQQWAIASLFNTLALESPLIEVEFGERDARVFTEMADRIQQDTGLRPSGHRYAGWLGVECPSVGAAVWMMRAVVVSNVLSRREDTVLFVPVHPGPRVPATLARIHKLAGVRGVL